MPTKINGMDGSPAAAVGARHSPQGPGDPSGAPAASAAGAAEDQKVQITGTARRLAGLEQALRALPAVNHARIAQLRAAIDDGSYAVRPQHIAEQLLSLEHALKGFGAADEAPGGSAGQTES